MSVRTTSACPRWAAAISAVPSVAAGDVLGARTERERDPERRTSSATAAIVTMSYLSFFERVRFAPAATRTRIASWRPRKAATVQRRAPVAVPDLGPFAAGDQRSIWAASPRAAAEEAVYLAVSSSAGELALQP